MIKWNYLFLTVFTTIGVGSYLISSLHTLTDRRGSINPPSVITIITPIVLGFLFMLFSLSSPSKIFNILGNIKSGFSLVMLTSIILSFVAIIQFLLKRRKNILELQKIFAIIVTIISLVYIYAVAKLYMIPAREALYTYAVPLFLISFIISIGVFIDRLLSEPKKDIYYLVGRIAIFSELIAVIYFTINLSVLETTDRYLSIDTLIIPMNIVSIIFYIGLVVGIFFPLFINLNPNCKIKGKINRIVTVITLLIGGVSFITILNVSSKLL